MPFVFCSFLQMLFHFKLLMKFSYFDKEVIHFPGFFFQLLLSGTQVGLSLYLQTLNSLSLSLSLFFSLLIKFVYMVTMYRTVTSECFYLPTDAQEIIPRCMVRLKIIITILIHMYYST